VRRRGRGAGANYPERVDVPLSRAVAPGLEVVGSVDSTNAELMRRAARLEHFAVLATDDQTAGRGRLGRTWVAPTGRTLAVSVFLASQPDGWIPLLAGVAMARAVRTLVGAEVSLKWPNDVRVDGLKVSGILAELAPEGVVLGAGLNLTLAETELPTPVSTSLTMHGADPDGLFDRALAAYLTELRSVLGTDAPREVVLAECDTIGRAVRVELPGGDLLEGAAMDLDRDGRLVVADASGNLSAVAAGDVTHVRPI
jgi:BirA family transcriptional regulator, biotin operon repressor / biotin---[acetyl-CoA-carboxylase] ligase